MSRSYSVDHVAKLHSPTMEVGNSGVGSRAGDEVPLGAAITQRSL